MTKQEVIVFSKLFWPEGGGGELAIYLIVKILSGYFNITVVSGTEKPHNDILKYYRYIYWPLLRTPFKPVEWLKIFLSFRGVEKLMRGSHIIYIPSHTLLPLAMVVKSLNPKIKVVLHLHNYQPISYTSVCIKGLRYTPVSEALIEYAENGSLMKAIATGLISPLNAMSRLALYYSDAIITVSRAQFETLRQYLGGVMKKAHIIYNPLPSILNVNKKLSEEPQLAYIGGGSYIKGFYVLLKAISKILKGTKVTLYIAGEITKEQELQVLKEIQRKTSGRLRVVGKLDHQEYLNLHEDLWALLIPSISEEPLPYAVMESMAIGTIPIASKVGGIPEIVEGTYAERMMFTPGDSNEMVGKMEEVLSLSKDQLIDIGYELREAVLKRFSSETVRRQLLKVFTA